MNLAKLAGPCLIASLVAPATALACHEMMFNAGRGLPFQAYVAPRAADVLILSNEQDRRDYEGLESAGHRLTLVADVVEMAKALEAHHYDIVIAAFESLDQVAPYVAEAEPAAPRLLPVISRSIRKDPEVRRRFEQVLIEGGSLGQYLTVIDRVLSHR